jgi:hypothetical protein
MTFTPACDSAVAIPNPMPDAAPVTKAVRPVRSCMCVFPLLLQLALADTIWFTEFIVLKLKGAPRACPGRVIRFTLTDRRSLPVFSN